MTDYSGAGMEAPGPHVPKARKRNGEWGSVRETEPPGGDAETTTGPLLTRPPVVLLGEVTATRPTASEAGRLREVGGAARGHTARKWWSYTGTQTSLVHKAREKRLWPLQAKCGSHPCTEGSEHGDQHTVGPQLMFPSLPWLALRPAKK